MTALKSHVPAQLQTAPLLASATSDESNSRQQRRWSRPALAGLLCALALSGTLKTLTTQLATNEGATKTSSLLLVWSNYFGQWLFGVVMRRVQRKTTTAAVATSSASLHSALVLIAVLDMIGCVVCLIATVLIGSGEYQVIYASILVMTAVLSRLLLGQKQTLRQWACLILVTLGLWACTFASSLAVVDEKQPDAASTNEASVLECAAFFPAFVCAHVSLHTLGVMTTLLGTLIYALQSVLSEAMSRNPALRVGSGELNGAIGFYGLLLSSAWVVLYTLPNWQSLVTEPMLANQLSWPGVTRTLTLYLIANVLHRAAYWRIATDHGAIFAGLANALRTVAVFFLSAALFCDAAHPTQCLSHEKTAAAMLVVGGVVAYQLQAGPLAKSVTAAAAASSKKRS